MECFFEPPEAERLLLLQTLYDVSVTSNTHTNFSKAGYLLLEKRLRPSLWVMTPAIELGGAQKAGSSHDAIRSNLYIVCRYM